MSARAFITSSVATATAAGSSPLMTMLRPLEVKPAVWATATSKPSVLTGASACREVLGVRGEVDVVGLRRTVSVALLAGRPLSAAVIVPKLVSPSPGTLVWTCSTSGSARRIVSASMALARTAAELVPAGGATVTWRSFSEPALMNWVGRSGTIAIETSEEDRRDGQDAPLRGPAAQGEEDRGGVGADPERVLRLAVLVDVELDPADEQVGQDRHDRQGDDERRQQGEGDGEGEGQEELADDAADEAERQEDRDGGEGRRR